MNSPTTLFQHWLQTVDQAPDRVLLTDARTARCWTAHQLNQAVNELDQTLAQPTAWAGQIVLLPLTNSVDWLTTFLLCLKHSAIPLPLDPDTPPLARQHLCQWLRPVAMRDSTGFHLHPQPSHHPDTQLIKLVAGMDGGPQALPFQSQHLLADLDHLLSSMAITSADSHYALIPMGHSYGLSSLVLPLIVKGLPLIIASDFYPSAIASDIARYRPTLFPAIPTLIRALNRSQLDPSAFASLNRVISAGDHLLAADAQVFLEKFGRRAHTFYGTSETGGISYDRTGDATLTGRSVGTPLNGVHLSLHPTGQLQVTSTAIPSAGPFLTADAAEILPDSEVKLTQRAPHLLKLSGRRLHPLEIENLLRAQPEIQSAHLTTYQDAFGELRSHLTYDGQLTPKAIRARLALHLPRWKIPHRITPFSEPRRASVRGPSSAD
jgi:long-chain acyl-CoA synthetase